MRYTASIMAAVTAAVLGIQAYHRQKQMRQLTRLCDKIDNILHGMETVQFGEFEEGAMNILSTEIQKMTVRLREQNAALHRDKAFMKEALEDMSHQLRTPLLISMELKGITLHIETEGNPGFMGDRQFCTEALGNIMKNCIEYAPADGEISVRAGETGLYTWICIMDSGEGIAPEELPHIFKRFYQSSTFSKRGMASVFPSHRK